MTLFLLAHLWVLIVGGAASLALSRRPATPGLWLAATALAVLPPVAALAAALVPDTPVAYTVAARLPEIVVVSGEAARQSLPSAPDWGGLVLAAYFLVAAAFAGVTLVRTVRLHRIARRAAPGPAPDVRVTDEDVPPLALGWPGAGVLLPRDVMDAPELPMLLAHERTHLAHRDPEWTLALLLIQSLGWANPGLRALVAGWRDAAEMRADAHAVRPDERRAYASFLLSRMRGSSLPVPTSLLPTHHRRSAMRLTQILAPAAPARARTLPTALALAGATVLSACAALAQTDSTRVVQRNDAMDSIRVDDAVTIEADIVQVVPVGACGLGWAKVEYDVDRATGAIGEVRDLDASDSCHAARTRDAARGVATADMLRNYERSTFTFARMAVGLPDTPTSPAVSTASDGTPPAPPVAPTPPVVSADGTRFVIPPSMPDAPLVRVPPVMPASCLGLDVSSVEIVEANGGVSMNVGKAVVRYDVDADGFVRNVDVVSASTPCFGPPSAASVAKWRYAPGRARTGETTQMRYVLTPKPGQSAEAALADLAR